MTLYELTAAWKNVKLHFYHLYENLDFMKDFENSDPETWSTTIKWAFSTTITSERTWDLWSLYELDALIG